MLGDSTGNVLTVNTKTLEFLQKINVFDCEIGLIRSQNGRIFIGNEKGGLSNVPINEGQDLFSVMGTQIEFDSPVVSISFDTKFNEGVVGTMSGTIRFINWQDETNV